MVYHFNLASMPKIENIYTVMRRTVWQVADPKHIFLLVLSGECTVQTGGESYRLKPGSSILLPAEQTYKRLPVDETLCEMLYIHFTLPGELQELENGEALHRINELKQDVEVQLMNQQSTEFASMTDLFLFPVQDSGEGDVLELGKKMKVLLQKYRLLNPLFATVYFCEILAHLSQWTVQSLQENETEVEVLKVPHNLKKAIWYIKQNYAKKISVKDLCAYCNISQSQLNRYFKRAFDTNCAQYIAELRVNRAKEIFLNSPEMPVKAVGSAVGFDDPHYFSRIFTRMTGETPTQYHYRIHHFLPPVSPEES